MFPEAHLYFGVALAGLASFLSPCVLPLVPPYLGYLGGTTLDQLTAAQTEDRALWRRVVLASLLFVLGFTTVFVLLGAGASYFGQIMQTYKNELSMVAGVVIILFGLHFLGLLRIPLLYSDTRFQADTGGGATLAGAYLIGLAFAFGWTPCIGPVLATVLSLAANEASLGAGVRLLAVYSLGLGIPFVAAALAIGPFLSFMHRYRRYLGLFEKVMGAVLIITGIMFLTGSLNTFGNWMLETFPGLQQVESWLTPESLPGEILKQKQPGG
jgi:cytochrome c-type biogenesis protein